MPTYDFSNIFDEIKDQDVFIMCTSPEISDLFLTPYGIEVMSDTQITMNLNQNVASFLDLQINISKEKRKLINDIFLNEWGFKDRVTIGINLFSAFYDTSIAMWGDGASIAMPKAILNYSNARYIATRQAYINKFPDLENINRVTHVYDWCGNQDRYDRCSSRKDILAEVSNGKRLYDLDYNGYIYWRKTFLIGAIYLCCVAKAKNVYIIGAGWNPKICNHFYEDHNKGKEWSFTTPEAIDMLESFKVNFPQTHIYKTGKDSLIPVPHIDIRKAVNGDKI